MLVHVLFLCPRACQVWHLARLDGFFIQAKDLVYFLDMLRQSIGDFRVRALRISVIYITYHIWFTRNAIIFDSTRCLARVIIESSCFF